jgi:curved DNA-binding protein CbpA
MTAVDHYEVLGVTPAASAAEIRAAYLRLARERHPDRFPDPEEKARAGEFFKCLSEAFNTLGNERSRRDYDAQRARGQRGPQDQARESYERALQHLEARQYHEAAELLRAAVALDAGQAPYHLALGRALSRNPNWAREALEAYEQAVRLAPRRADGYVELGRLLLAKGLRLRARRVVEAGLRIIPNDADLRQLLEECADEAAPGPATPASSLLERLRRKGPGA